MIARNLKELLGIFEVRPRRRVSGQVGLGSLNVVLQALGRLLLDEGLSRGVKELHWQTIRAHQCLGPLLRTRRRNVLELDIAWTARVIEPEAVLLRFGLSLRVIGFILARFMLLGADFEVALFRNDLLLTGSL